MISRAERVLQLGAKASKRLPLNLVENAFGEREIGATEQIDEVTRPLALDEGGLFPDLVAGETETSDEDSLPLLNAKGVAGGES